MEPISKWMSAMQILMMMRMMMMMMIGVHALTTTQFECAHTMTKPIASQNYLVESWIALVTNTVQHWNPYRNNIVQAALFLHMSCHKSPMIPVDRLPHSGSSPTVCGVK